jgi:hypothetical protein
MAGLLVRNRVVALFGRGCGRATCPAAVFACLAWVCTFLVALLTAAQAQNQYVRSPPAIANAVRIDTTEAPTIDGDLSDPVWAKSEVLEPMIQTQPDLGALTTERTDVFILYDEDNLYFGIYAYDSEPDQIAVRAMARDGNLGSGDTIRIILDPGMTRRNAFTFQIAPSGGRVDALLQNNTTNFAAWDAIWEARANVVEDGYVIEVSIPFRSLSYESDATEWGFEFTRQIRHKNETVRWSNFSPIVSFTDVAQAGALRGIRDVNEGSGLDIQVYGVARVKQDWSPSRTSPSGTVGGNAYYKITPALTGTLTVNPDFSDAPLDIRQVNTTRFSLFTPETRDFFLQDIPVFEFGGVNFVGTNNARPFFSRNIGLVNGTPVSLLVGGKLSGEHAGFGIGALSVYTNDNGITPSQLLTAARVTHRVFSESRFGVVVTNGDPTGLTDNTVVGGDFQYRESNFLGSYVFTADSYFEQSSSSKYGNDNSFGLAMDFPNEPWGGKVTFKQVGENFRPALGFANRRGIRDYFASGQYRRRFRDRFYRDLAFVTENNFITDLDNHLETRKSTLRVDMETQSVDRFSLNVSNYFESVPAQFNLPGNVPILAGDYNWTNFGGSIETSTVRMLAASAEFECCSFYNGEGYETTLELAFRPNQYFELSTGWTGTFLDLPTGAVDIHLLTADSVVNFAPDMQLAMQAQYDNISKSFGFLARYRWEFRPGSELFVALGQSAFVPYHQVVFQTTQFSIRLGHTIRL